MSLPRLATFVASITAFVLAISKVIIGIMTGSVAVIASAIDSLLDMIISIFNNIAVKISESKPDKKYNYGKGKIEGVAALFEGLFISGSGLYIIYEGIRKIVNNEPIINVDYSIYVMLFSMVVTLFLVIFFGLCSEKN